MKKVLVTMAVLALVASVGQASVLQVWLTADTVTAANVDFNVYVYARVVADPSIVGEDLTDMGIGDLGFTVYSSDTTGKLAPVYLTPAQTGVVKMTFNAVAFDNGTNVRPARTDYLQQPGGADGDLDAVGAAVATSGADSNVGVSPLGVLVGTQTWKFSTLTSAYLAVTVNSTSRHWNWNIAAPYKEAFSAFETTGVFVGPPPVTAVAPGDLTVTGPTRVATGYTGTWTLNQGSGDPAVTGSLIWGDTNTSPLAGALPQSANHAYAAPGSYTVTGSATNEGGTGNTATGLNVTVVDNPSAITVTVDGVAITNGQVLTIYGHNYPVIVASGQGTIDGWTFKNNGTELAAANTWTGDSYGLYGGTLTFTAFNTATGSTPATFSFSVVPEPATLALLGFGAVATLLRRKK